jgi:hypothetical protein
VVLSRTMLNLCSVKSVCGGHRRMKKVNRRSGSLGPGDDAGLV